jgi:cell division protein FtsX
VLAIAANIIRLIIRTRRESIGVWLLLGASPMYARMPYYIEGALAGLAGGLVSLLLLYFTCTWLSGFVPAFQFFTAGEAVTFLLVAVGTALSGAILAARRQIVPL